MKISFKLLSLFLILSFSKTKAETVPYIRIDYIAKVYSKYAPPILISARKLNKSDFFSESDYDRFKKLLPNPNDFVDSQYKFIITDDSTLKLLDKYIYHQIKNYDYSSAMEDGYILITTTHKQLFIPNRLWSKFSDELFTYLHKKGCDINIIRLFHQT